MSKRLKKYSAAAKALPAQEKKLSHSVEKDRYLGMGQLDQSASIQQSIHGAVRKKMEILIMTGYVKGSEVDARYDQLYAHTLLACRDGDPSRPKYFTSNGKFDI